MPSSRDLPDPGIEPMSLTSLALAGGFLATSATWEACNAQPLTVYPTWILCDSSLASGI